jgi:hypothetical protein
MAGTSEMPTYSEKQTFYAYKDKEGKLVTPLYDGQAPATKYLVDKLERPLYADPKWKFETDYSAKMSTWAAQEQARKAHFKALRDEARKGLSDYILVTYRLVQFVGPKTAR